MEKSKRSTNLELLRILAMLMIITHHYALHSGFQFQDGVVTVNKIIIDILSMFGKLGVCIYIIISGYFYDKTKFNFKKLFNIILKV